ncbi:MAG: hypothetical protein M1357_00815 [Candidatus Marsarchaeota archaeon]|nr:hypothetical protein [Candidatus Marsarchaeota archaeon]
MASQYVATGHARLHVALIDMNGSLGRVDGSVGVVLDEPVVKVTASPAERLSSDKRLSRFASKFMETYGRVYADLRLPDTYPAHVGMGWTTQASLAVATVLAQVKGVRADVFQLAEAMGRGGASGIGVYAFAGAGSFIVDAGHKLGSQKRGFLPSDRSDAPVPPLVFAANLPPQWRFLVCIPKHSRKVYGAQEARFFKSNCPVPASDVERLSRVVLFKLIPSVIERDCDSFGDAVQMIQGLGFKKKEVEYQGKTVFELMAAGTRAGASGAGMSSFGPTVYFVAKSERKVKRVCDEVSDMCLTTHISKPYLGGKGLGNRLS